MLVQVWKNLLIAALIVMSCAGNWPMRGPRQAERHGVDPPSKASKTLHKASLV
jgi:hypothetical protein